MIIKNEKQYQCTLDRLRQFEKSIADLSANERLKAEPVRWQLYRDSYQSQVEELKAEIAEYERLVTCDDRQPIQIKVESLNKLPDVLIKARIAAKMTQQELAEILGIEEERVRQYEDTDYQCASFVEILEVSTVLGGEFATAVMQVDFEEIEVVKQSAEKWRKGKETIAASSSG